MRKRQLLLTLFVLLSSTVAFIANANDSDPTVQKLSIHNHNFKAVEIKPEKLQLHWKNEQGQPYDNFSQLKKQLNQKQQTVRVMMNAGIYTNNDQPAGLHIENNQQQHAVNRRTGKGNFHLQPNGIFYLTNKNFPAIRTTASFVKKYGNNPQKHIRLATQSGPMLLINGKINQQFKEYGGSLYSRNGVCVTQDDRVLFFATAIFSKSNLYHFAQAALQFGCHNALYLDGSISKLYIKGDNTIFHLGYFVGILTEAEPSKMN